MSVEIIVVDDGSRLPAEGILSTLVAPPPFSLRVLRQENAGPAAARNAGFRTAQGEIVLFLDDDILVPADLVARHLEAHQQWPNAVVCGVCRYSAEPDSPLRRYINALGAPPAQTGYLKVDHVASNQLSVERRGFTAAGGLYREDLRTPAAEEFELSYRLSTTGVPIILAPGIVAIHFQPVEVSALCAQQYKYGVGLAEAAAKCAELKGMPELQHILSRNQALRSTDSPATAARKILKAFLGGRRTRRWAERSVRVIERASGRGVLLEASYRALLGASFYVGLQEGRRLYPSC